MSARTEKSALAPAPALVVERTASVAVRERDHDRLRDILRAELGGPGTMVGFRRVLGWTIGDRGVEVHAQIAPRDAGSAIRIAQRGYGVQPRALAGLAAMTSLAMLVGLFIVGRVDIPPHLIGMALGMPAAVVGLVGGIGWWTSRRRARKMERAADAIVRELEAHRAPDVRVETAEEAEDEAAADARARAAR